MQDEHLEALIAAFRVCRSHDDTVPVLVESFLFLVPVTAFETLFESEFQDLVTRTTREVYPEGGEITLKRFCRETEQDVRSSKKMCLEDSDWKENLRRQVMLLLKKTKCFDDKLDRRTEVGVSV